MKLGGAVFAAYLGIKAPEIFLNNKIGKRQKTMGRAYPNMVDLLIICAESGMSIEHAVRKVSQEIGAESIELAEEMSLLAAEMSYLETAASPSRTSTNRTGLDSVKQLSTVLMQSEKYGTPLGAALRVLAQESREARLTAAEKKAAALPPALTVPMIIFFLPGLFCAILTPAIIQINHWNLSACIRQSAPGCACCARRPESAFRRYVRRTRPRPAARALRARSRSWDRALSRRRSIPSSAAPSRRSTARCWCWPAPAPARRGC